MLEDKIINNNYDNVDYSYGFTSSTPIAISPLVSDRYEDALSEDIGELYARRHIYEDVAEIFEASPYFQKYGRETKKLEKRDVSDIYYTFKDELKKKDSYSLVQIFCAIAEFFELNYKTLYNDIISLEDKAEILEILQESYGLESTLSTSKRLF